MDFGFLVKKLVTLIALVDPFLIAPLFLTATVNMTEEARVKFARQLGLTVALGLLIGGLLGMHVLSLLGVSIGSMQLAGGLIALVVALAMVLAKEEEVKTTVSNPKGSLVPLGMPLLVGPAALAYVMATSEIHQAWDVVNVVIPPVLVGMLTWVVLGTAAKTQQFVSKDVLTVMERVGGFLLAAIAMEMMATGLRALFPKLLG